MSSPFALSSTFRRGSGDKLSIHDLIGESRCELVGILSGCNPLNGRALISKYVQVRYDEPCLGDPNPMTHDPNQHLYLKFSNLRHADVMVVRTNI
jgi:hypothetical protein